MWHALGRDYFYAYFWEGMPDLNNTNPQVTTEMEKVIRFWLEQVGIDGFRLDTFGALIFYTANPGLFACLRITPDESLLVVVNLTDSSIQDAQFSLLSSTMIEGEYASIALLDKKPLATVIVLDHGRIRNYLPVPDIPPYATIMMQLKKQ